MIQFPNAKINLGLHITRKRADGYHDLETVFYPVQIKDALEALPAGAFQFSSSGLPIQGNATDNLCVKAWELLKKTFPDLPPVHLHLHKHIPMGAGLGGGSADGAFTLRLLNKLFQLNLSPQQLIGFALQLGSDCPFFIHNEPCYATGRGEVMTPLAIDLAGYRLVLVNPGIHVPTGWAFSQLTPHAPERSLTEVVRLPVAEWKHYLFNDFEAPVSAQYPVIGQIKAQLYEQGAVYAAMSGSGSTVYGLFKPGATTALSFPDGHLVLWAS